MAKDTVQLIPGEYLITLFTDVEAEDDGGWFINDSRPIGVFRIEEEITTHRHLAHFVHSHVSHIFQFDDFVKIEIEDNQEIYCICDSEGRPLLEVALH
jgi:hypothetical protein